MTAVVTPTWDVAKLTDRMKAGKRHDQALRDRGRFIGQNWAADTAGYRELKRLSRDWQYDPTKSAADVVHSVIDPGGNSSEFWGAIFGDDSIDDATIEGFAEGAREVALSAEL